jgi:beta-lactamase class A
MRKLTIALPFALAAAAVLATPAAAASFASPGQLRAEINQLDRQANEQRRGISPRESQQLERQVDQLQNLYARYARGGFTRTELNTLGARVDAVRTTLRAQKFDRNGHRGIDGRTDRHDRYDRNDRWDRR